MTAIPELLERFANRDRRALAEILTRVEIGETIPLPAAPAQTQPTRVVGITGSGGAGKSTLVAGLIGHLRSRGLSVGVLACDPQSPVTGGALLGDRIRVRFDPADEGVYFRSLSTRGAPGGISAATRAARDWLVAFGFDVVLVETVGVGQDQIAVRDLVDTLVLLVTPNTGDEVQWEKAGLIEVADLIVVNKSDLPGADRVRHQLVSALTLSANARQVPVLNVTASTGQGVAELWTAISGQ
ncbi:MAG: methylmalonyl Co-A mutase-associated GTPase MeaB [Planctomycetia bacterium]|nr:methylmalonyl Co-A mutase-associated GTPase MeaB [Planctomycetia bacterium]